MAILKIYTIEKIFNLLIKIKQIFLFLLKSMEARLIATRNLMKESNRDRRSATISSIESTR